MNIENELKLIPTSDISIEQIIELLREQGIIVLDKEERIHQEDTYFDDINGTLEKTGGSFRIRRKNGINITYKEPIESDTEYKQRKEYEIGVSQEYGQNIDMQLAINILKEHYPELVLPRDMKKILTVVNDRDKVNLTCSDGTSLEITFDTLQGIDEKGNIYPIQPEIEFETISGNPENLTKIYEAIIKSFPEQISKNTLSKYVRTKKEIKEYKMDLSVEELATCALFSQILNSNQFNKLKYKGQILYRYDKPTIPQLDNFKDFDYLVDRISKIKSGEYKIPIPRNIAEKENIAKLLENGNYDVKDDIDLEDMFCILLSDVDYEVADEVLADFLDRNYFQQDKAETNRLSHSQQVMLGTGLSCKSSQVRTSLGERLTCMISALSHDIGHVPLAHIMENVIRDQAGFFSHESNGKRIVNIIYEQNLKFMIQNIKIHLPNINIEDIKKVLQMKKDELARSIADHSRSNSETRGKGPNVQIPRAADKICYVVSDLKDFERLFERVSKKDIDILDDEWLDSTIKQICKDKQYLYEEVRKKLCDTYITPLKTGKYGRTLVNTINSIKNTRHGGHEYYDVDQDIWDFMVKLIKRIKQTRIEIGIDSNRSKMETIAGIVLIKLTDQFLEKFNGNKEKARLATIDCITNMGELDLLDYTKEITLLSPEQLRGEKPVSRDSIIAMKTQICKRVEKLSRLAGKDKRDVADRVRGVKRYLEQLSPEEIVEFYSKFNIVLDSEIENVKRIKKTEDTQLKIRQTANLSIEDILIALDLEAEGLTSRYTYKDRYYSTHDLGRTICIRQVEGEENQTLIVKDFIPKNVKQVNRHRYQTSGTDDLTIKQMIEKINQENPGINITIDSDKPIKELSTRRIEYRRDINGTEVIFSSDTVTDSKGRTYKEIEIKCSEDTTMINELKKKLQEIFNNRIRFTKNSKADNFPKTTER